MESGSRRKITVDSTDLDVVEGTLVTTLAYAGTITPARFGAYVRTHRGQKVGLGVWTPLLADCQ
ncbi:MAG TPA: hypothetical protein VHA79_13040 [Mycobacteriales bacterium]|nr:hypothetical protein [Mycobacteriales bacterium]